MANEKKDPGGVVGLQIEAPTPTQTPIRSDKGHSTPNLPKPLTLEEKKYLLAVERGDLANVRRVIQRAHRRQHICINCMDSLGRGALTLAIDGENLEMVELLIIMGVETNDALLQAINAEFVEAVELLLEHEELIHREGEPYSWQKTDINTAMFTPDITPLMCAAHRNNYEILKILLDRGATLPLPHDVKCGCDECIKQSSDDSLRHSLTRVNEYRALSSPSLIALSSNDPLLTAFQLSWELRNLAFAEQECKSEYLELRRQCQKFAVDLLDQSRSSQELAIILNHDPESPHIYVEGEHMKLARLELAINYKQKSFVAHPNIQQLLAAMWYEGVPGFRRKSAMEKLLITVKVAVLFPLYCVLYMIAPNCQTGKFMRKPFMKFLIHASSYLFFLFVLILVSQRAEVQIIQLFGTESMRKELEEQLQRQRGTGPTPLELLVVIYVLGFIWEETQEIYSEGIQSYLRNMWNFIDFTRNFLYCMVAILRVVAYVQQTNEIKRDPTTAYIAREKWDDFDPQLIAEGLFAAANIFSALKLVHMFSINPHLGPLQISLGRMVIDIVKFFFIYSLVLFAFACGLNQLLWYFADLEKRKCYILPGGLPDWDNGADACMKWRRFGNLFESSQSLFWASFGMVGLENFELAGIKSYTRFWGLLMFGSYSVINVIVLLNLLIAMMSNSYAMIDEHSDTEWKFARTKLWLSYFEESSTLPPPFNIFPTVKILMNLFGRKKRAIERKSTIRRKEEQERDNRYTNVMRSLVWRYVSAMNRKFEENAVTEDDINEVKGEISAMRYEMLEIFEKNGMDVSSADRKEKTVLAKRMKVWERRLMKDFQVAPVANEDHDEDMDKIIENETSLSKFRRVARQVANQSSSYKWGQVIQEVGVTKSQIGRCRNRESFKNQQNLQKAMNEARRLVEKCQSPLLQSRSTTPIEDASASTLMQLLQNLTEEVGETSPVNTLSVHPMNKRSRPVTPISTLSKQLQSVDPPPLSQKKIPGSTVSFKPTSSDGVRIKSPPLVSISKSPPPASKFKSPPLNEACKSPPLNDVCKSPSPNEVCKSPPSNDVCKSPPSADISISSPSGEVCISPPFSIQSPPPIIQITRTESQLKQKTVSYESLIDVEDKINPKTEVDTIKITKEEPTPLISSTNSPPKVIKRKHPVLPTTTTTTTTIASSSDIIVSRPLVPKPQPGQGMIPPPPTNLKPETKVELAPIQTTSISDPLKLKPSIVIDTQILDTPIINTSIIDDDESLSITLDSIKSGSTEKLVEISESNINPCSPPCLRPIKNLENVQTLKRQQKSGWL